MDTYNEDYNINPPPSQRSHNQPTSQRPIRRPMPADFQDELPTGTPTGPATRPLRPQPERPTASPTPSGERMTMPMDHMTPPTVESTYYIPGYLATQIGKTMRIEFLIGTTGPMVDRIGTLLSVGASYILIRPIGTDDVLLCDIYSIKFATIYVNDSELHY